MPVILTRSAQHLRIQHDTTAYSCTTFHDGELSVKIDPSIINQKVTVVIATCAPAENIIELFLVLSALASQKCTARIIFTYFGYARQDHPVPGVAPAAHLLGNWLKKFHLDQTIIVHAHSNRLHNFVNFEPFIPFDLYTQLAHDRAIDVIVAPDRGAQNACKCLAEQAQCNFAHVDKKRSEDNHVQAISLEGNVRNKNVLLFDDIISTGTTLASAAQLLREHGARQIYALTTHGLIDAQTMHNISTAPIEELYTTNTIDQRLADTHLKIIDISQHIDELTKTP